MTWRVLRLVTACLWLCVVPGAALGQIPESLPTLNYEVIRDFFQLPPGEHLVEPAGIAVNSKGHIYVFHRGKHPLMEFDASGKFLRTIAETVECRYR